MSNTATLNRNPNSSVDEALPLPMVNCRKHGDFAPMGSAIYQSRRDCEFEDEHDNGFELRDYLMFAHQVGCNQKQLWVIKASVYAARNASISIQLNVRSRTWQIISARPLSVR